MTFSGADAAQVAGEDPGDGAEDEEEPEGADTRRPRRKIPHVGATETDHAGGESQDPADSKARADADREKGSADRRDAEGREDKEDPGDLHGTGDHKAEKDVKEAIA